MNTSKSCHCGMTFSMPMTEISTSGSVRHMRPLPSLSTTHTVPVSATAKFAPLIATLVERNFLRRCARATAASAFGIVRQLGDAERAHEQLADFGAVLVNRRNQNMRRMLVGKLNNQLGQVGLAGRDPGVGERLVELDLVGGQRLDLNHLAGIVALHNLGDDLVSLGGVARPVNRAASALHCRFELRQIRAQMPQCALLDRTPGLAQRLPVRQFIDDNGALGANRLGGLAHVAAQLRICQRLGRIFLEHRIEFDQH